MDIFCGDSLEMLKTMESSSVDSMVTDPPAGISFMQKKWDDDKGGPKEWRAWLCEVMGEALRVLKPGAHGLVWSIPRTSHWTGMALERAGFEIRDAITHHFGSGFPKNHDVGKAIDKEAGAEREVISTRENRVGFDVTGMVGGGWAAEEVNITAPSTPQAKLWDGFGTALKPSSEIWWRITKPLTPIPAVSMLLEEVSNNIGELLWLSCPVKFVELISKSKNQDSLAVMSGFALYHADVLFTQESLKRSDLMAMFRSQEEGSTFLSIAMLWDSILGEVLRAENTCTIEIISGMTTGLRILKSSISKIITSIIPGQRIQANGSRSLAGDAKNLSINSRPCIKSTALESALGEACTILASVADQVSMILGQESEGIVQENVTNQEVHPSSEIWWLVRKPFKGSIASNVLKHGTGGINVDGCRVKYEAGDKLKGKVIQVRTSGDIYGGSSYHESATKGFDGGIPSHDVGRWPTNTLLTHSAQCSADECVDGCPVLEIGKQSGDLISGSRIAGNYKQMGYQGNGQKPLKSVVGDTGTAARFFPCFRYQAKPSQAEKEAGLSALPLKRSNKLNEGGMQARRDAKADKAIESQGLDAKGRTLIRADGSKTLVDRFIPQFRANNHPTVKPIELMRWLCRLVTPPGGMVLDPFMGSGTTGCAAVMEGFNFTGIEQNEEYCDIARKRIEWWRIKTSRQVSKNEPLDEDGKPRQGSLFN